MSKIAGCAFISEQYTLYGFFLDKTFFMNATASVFDPSFFSNLGYHIQKKIKTFFLRLVYVISIIFLLL
jgi:hypothetical protein